MFLDFVNTHAPAQQAVSQLSRSKQDLDGFDVRLVASGWFASFRAEGCRTMEIHGP